MKAAETATVRDLGNERRATFGPTAGDAPAPGVEKWSS